VKRAATGREGVSGAAEEPFGRTTEGACIVEPLE